MGMDKAVMIANFLRTEISNLLGQSENLVRESFNGNTQEGENLTISNQIITFDRETMQEINQRFGFLERLLIEERKERQSLSAYRQEQSNPTP
jgi:hypothetical protein